MSTAEILGAPVSLGPVGLQNRLVIAPHTVNFGFSEGSPGDDYVAYMTRRARGFGLTWVPLAAPDPLGRAEPAQPWLWDDRFVPGLARLAEALRSCGTEPGLQLCHAGRQTSPSLLDGETPVAPSPEPPRSIYTTIPRELTVGEIGALVEAYAAAARRAAAAGFRALNLHFAHGYLVHQFLSADSNHRVDGYGGPLENRMRFALEIVDAVRAEVGREVAVEVRLNGSDFVAGGIEIGEAVAIAQAVLARGADGVSVSGGVYGSSPFILLLPYDDQAFLPLASAIRAATGAVVTAVGKIRTPEEAAAAVRAGVCDLVGVGRAVMADPDWALKALGLVRQPVRPCLGTLDGCAERLRHFEPATCQVMPDVGRELRVVPRSAPRRLAVVGAGPGGCEAAVYAAERGDEVLLVEAGDVVGGALRLAARAPGGAAFGELADFHAAELARLGVDVALGTRADAALLAGFEPDHVIVATGARPDVPGIEGYATAPLATDEDVLAGEVDPSGHVVVVGAGRRALVTALLCADRGGIVTVVDHDRLRPAHDASALMRRAYRQQLEARQIQVLAGPVRRLTPASVVLDEVELPADLVVLAARLRSLRESVKAVPAGVAYTVIGDAKEPRSIMDAIAEAREAVDQLHLPRGSEARGSRR
jgi:2,4-dienoyl-CoA reductase-like NADH-dependent reductase (Old Yellow Enzyme family)/thioredoxin reductase